MRTRLVHCLLLLAPALGAGAAHAQSVRCLPALGSALPGDNCDGVQGDA